MGVRLMNLASGNSVVALARNAESAEADAVEDVEAGENPGNEIVDEGNDLGDDGV
jgi:DNA gyrase subunit A